eukprot:CAMPEP_0119056114 /NCGR_PEP_ID=MMETSP1178-20130426/811_1 /TAXON_ID=33656 /ORGANISM="unid sp, Strain CCMP2000" /LENGTH=104 /DNA_ID=CAMNT_0007036809 /DNA_START=275 /DNA_END=589 /DNA_ORIENTATION=-
MSAAALSSVTFAAKDHTANYRAGGTKHGPRGEVGRAAVGPACVRWLHDHSGWRRVPGNRLREGVLASPLVHWLTHRHGSVSASGLLLAASITEADAQEHKQHEE